MSNLGVEREFERDEVESRRGLIRYWSPKVEKAFQLGRKSHEGQVRKKSGLPYFIHCVEVTGIIHDWLFQEDEVDEIIGKFPSAKFIEDLTCAALLHDTVEDTGVTINQIEEEFGHEVAVLVDGVSKFISPEGSEGTDHETIKKVLQGYYVDPRVVVIKLADRTHNMRDETRAAKAWETEEIYSRLAEALGMWKVMRDLKDVSFPHRMPEQYAAVKCLLDQDLRRRPEYIEPICDEVRSILDTAGLKGEVGYRLGGYRAIDQKRRRLLRPRSGYLDISDVLSIGVTLETENDCYRFLGNLRNHFESMIDYSRSEDSLAVPEDNGYQVLREVVNFPFGAVEVAIATREQMEFNHWGVVSLIRRGQEDLSNYRLKMIFTPDGEVRVMPLSSNGWDVAAAINPQLALTMRSILVNGRHVLPSSIIPHASEVKIVAENGFGVFVFDASWKLNDSLPRTVRILEGGLHRMEFDKQVAEGRIKARDLLTPRGVIDFEDIANEIEPKLPELGCKTIDELLFAIGGGEVRRSKLNKILDEAGVTKSQLGLSTIWATGLDRPGILKDLANKLDQLGANVVIIKNRGNHHFDLRIVVRGLSNEMATVLREEMERDGRFAQVLVV